MSTITSTKPNFLELVDVERGQQIQRWGNEHDDRHTIPEWSHLLNLYSGKVAIEIEDADTPHPAESPWPERIQQRLVTLAAVAMAAYDAIERATPEPAWSRSEQDGELDDAGAFAAIDAEISPKKQHSMDRYVAEQDGS